MIKNFPKNTIVVSYSNLYRHKLCTLEYENFALNFSSCQFSISLRQKILAQHTITQLSYFEPVLRKRKIYQSDAQRELYFMDMNPIVNSICNSWLASTKLINKNPTLYKKYHKIDKKPPHHKQVYNIKILKNRHYFTNIL